MGAGPVTVLGKIWNGHRLDITAVDPLGEEYGRLLEKYDIVPPVKTQTAPAEELIKYFAENAFDVVYARNCIDHSYAPVQAVQQMIAVTRPGGCIVLQHESNEGSNELYRGLHQWNFRQENGDFVVASPARPSVNVSKQFAHLARFSCEEKEGWLTVIALKQ